MTIVFSQVGPLLREYTFDFPVHDITQVVSVELWDEDNDKDDFLGECKVDISVIVQEYARWVEKERKISESPDGQLNPNDEDYDDLRGARGFTEKWFKLSGKDIEHGEVKLCLNWLKFSTEIPQTAPKSSQLNQYFIGTFLNSVTRLPDHLRGRHIFVEIILKDKALTIGHRHGSKRSLGKKISHVSFSII